MFDRNYHSCFLLSLLLCDILNLVSGIVWVIKGFSAEELSHAMTTFFGFVSIAASLGSLIILVTVKRPGRDLADCWLRAWMIPGIAAQYLSPSPSRFLNR